MSGTRQLPPWPNYPNIPVYVDPPDGSRTSQETNKRTSHSPGINTGRSPRFFRIEYAVHTPLSSPNLSPKPLPPRPEQLPRQYPLDNTFPRGHNHRSRPRRSMRRKFHTETFLSPPPPRSDYVCSGDNIGHGLGISGSSIDGGEVTLASSGTDQDEPNFAQRFEKRLWRYNTSGNVVKRWLLEIISWILGALSMGAILGILIYFQDGSLPKWPLGLTLNAYVSLLSKVSSAALLFPTSEALGQLKWSWFQRDSKKMWDFEIFDNASRGSWGSILLLIRTKGRSLASLGALITLFSLALEPFFQQAIHFPERWVCDGWNSTIPKVLRYEPTPSRLFVNREPRFEPEDDADDVVDRFFYGNGTQPVPFGNGTRAEIPLSCPTSNCTWPAYETLGICSSCADLSGILSFGCYESRVDWVTNLTGIGTKSTYPNGTACGYWLNGTSEFPTLMSGYLVEPVNTSIGGARHGEALLMRTVPLLDPLKPLFGGSIRFGHIRHRIVDVVISGSRDYDTVFRNETPTLQECVLSWCVKTVKSSYYWANYKEEIIDTYVDTTPGPFPFGSYFNPSINKSQVQYIENVTMQLPYSKTASATYGISNVTALGFVGAFARIFPSMTTANQDMPRGPSMRLASFKDQRVLELEFNPWMPPNNVTLHMERLATAWTNVIRSSSSRDMIPGMAFSKENYVSVRWNWLILPFSILFLTFIFLVAVIAKATRERERVGIWKTSAIATLLYGLPDDMQKKITLSASTGTPRAKAKDLRVRMLSKGWRVSGNILSPTTPRTKINEHPPGWI